MLEERQVEFIFRDYRTEPLDAAEVNKLLLCLGARPRDVLRRRDRTFRELGLSGDESEEVLVSLMVAHPTLLERPIGVVGKHAVIGRPPERLLELLDPQPDICAR